VVEPHRQQPPTLDMLDTTVAAAAPKVSVQVGDRLGDTSVMRGQHRPARRRIAQAIEDGHALGRTQHNIERGHSVAAVGAAEELAALGMAALEHPLEPRW
jgi:hypothetical protein